MRVLFPCHAVKGCWENYASVDLSSAENTANNVSNFNKHTGSTLVAGAVSVT